MLNEMKAIVQAEDSNLKEVWDGLGKKEQSMVKILIAMIAEKDEHITEMQHELHKLRKDVAHTEQEVTKLVKLVRRLEEQVGIMPESLKTERGSRKFSLIVKWIGWLSTFAAVTFMLFYESIINYIVDTFIKGS